VFICVLALLRFIVLVCALLFKSTITERVIKAVILGVLCGGMSMRNDVMVALVEFEGRGE
jgi:hypothetical protein